MPKNRPSISIFFPFLNDWGTVGSLIGLAIATVQKLTDDWEVIIVDDGSSDDNHKALLAIADIYNSGLKNQKSKIKNQKEKVRIIKHEENRGYGGALRSGFAAATKDLVFYTDCDAQYDPRELTKLYQAMEEGERDKGDKRDRREIGMVNGYKIKRSDPWYRTLAGKIYHHLVKIAFGLPIRDTDCDFRLIRREVFDPSMDSTRASTAFVPRTFDRAQSRASGRGELSRMSSPQAGSGQGKVKLFENTGTICVELVKKIDYHGYKIVEIPVHHFWRTSGKSQFFNFERLFKTGGNLLKLWWKLIVLKQC